VEPCRKCQAPNPKTNQYCRSCGALLDVSTTLINAQRSWILPAAKGIRWKWVLLGAFAMLGFVAILIGGLSLVTAVVAGDEIGARVTDLAGLARELFGLVIAATALFLVAFGLGGLATSLVARRRTVLESVIAGLAALLLLGAVSTALAVDAVWVVLVLALPSAALAGLGGWIGELFSGGKTR
jgi:hypothetical protein